MVGLVGGGGAKVTEAKGTEEKEEKEEDNPDEEEEVEEGEEEEEEEDDDENEDEDDGEDEGEDDDDDDENERDEDPSGEEEVGKNAEADTEEESASRAEKRRQSRKKSAKVAVASNYQPHHFARPERPVDRDGRRVTEQKSIARAWENGPQIDLNHFHYVQEDYTRRQQAVDYIRERMKKKSRPGYELRVQRKWTVSAIVQILLRRYFSWTPCVRTTLGNAAWDGDILQVHTLLLIRGEVNARDANGQLILNICIQQQHEPITRLLLDRGADFDLQDEGTLMTPLNYSIIMGNKALTRRLLNNGADVNLADGEGMTPLIWASMRGYLELVAQLVEYGANVNHQDIEGWTPLHIVCFKGYVELVDYFLVTVKARTDLEDANGFTAFMYARFAGNDDVVKKLDEHAMAVKNGTLKKKKKKKRKKRNILTNGTTKR